MQFSELELPDSIDEDSEPRVLRALRMYSLSHYEGQPNVHDDLSDLLDEFNGQRAFVVIDNDERIQAIANYDDRPSNEASWIEGLATHREARGIGIGRFLVRNLANIAQHSGKKSIELRSLPDAITFYERLGFDYVGEPTRMPVMRLDVRR